MSHSNNCCVVHEPAICEDLDLHIAIFLQFFLSKTAWKWKNLDPQGGVPGAPLDPPMYLQVSMDRSFYLGDAVGSPSKGHDEIHFFQGSWITISYQMTSLNIKNSYRHFPHHGDGCKHLPWSSKGALQHSCEVIYETEGTMTLFLLSCESIIP